jgi:hypothetical protein
MVCHCICLSGGGRPPGAGTRCGAVTGATAVGDGGGGGNECVGRNGDTMALRTVRDGELGMIR